MGKRNEPIKCICKLIMPDGTILNVDDIPVEKRIEYGKIMAERSERVMNRYYSQHPEDYAKL